MSDRSADGKYILYSARGGTNRGWDLWALPVGITSGDRTPIPVVGTQFNEIWATFSPDGKYIAYQSNESGRTEIYVQEFPDARNKWQINWRRWYSTGPRR